MFNQDNWQEILNTLAKNKFRTILTAFGVFWGILMLVIMLGSAKGLSNGMYLIMGDFATNSLFIWPENTTIPFKGFPKDRSWRFTNEDTKVLKDNISEIEIVAPRTHPPHGNNLFIRGKNTGAFNINGDYPEYFKIDPVTLTQGRLLNDLDLKDRRKVVVIGKRVKESLFDANENPIGQYIQIQGVYFQVIGVFKSKHTQGWGTYQNEAVFMPFTTLQKTYNLGNIVRYYSITAKRQYSVAFVEKKIRALLATRHSVSTEDIQAFGSNNIEEQFKTETEFL